MSISRSHHKSKNDKCGKKPEEKETGSELILAGILSPQQFVPICLNSVSHVDITWTPGSSRENHHMR